jgi:hypothetical protein
MNTYGTIDLLVKLLQDNGIESIDSTLPSSMTWVWDETLSKDQKINIVNISNNVTYATSATIKGSVLSIILNDNQTSFNNTNIQNPIIVTPPTTGGKMIAEIQYIATGGESSVPEIDLVGSTIIQITREVQILENSEYSFNPTTGTITLSGDTLATGEVLFIIYQTSI